MKPFRDLFVYMFSTVKRTAELYGFTCVCMGVMGPITALVLCARSQDLLVPVAVRRGRVVISTSEFRGGGRRCPKTREILVPTQSRPNR